MDEFRSFLRKREAWARKSPQADSHVQIYTKRFTETERKKFVCPSCDRELRNLDRPRDSDGKMKKHCGCATLKTLCMTPEQLTEHKRQVRIALKAKYRREAGQRLRSDIQAEAKKKREASASVKQPKLHDAHVRRYLRLRNEREKYAKRYKAQRQKEIDRQSKYKQRLPDAYVVTRLKEMGLGADGVCPALIAVKREAILFRRLSLQAKTILKDLWKENHEAIK